MAIFGEASRASIAGFILTVVSFLFQLIGFATPFWMYQSFNGKKAYEGLWQVCGSNDGTTKCFKIACGDGCPDTFKATRAMSSLGFIVLLAAVVIVALKLFVFKDKPILKSVGVVCCFIGGTCALIGTIIYGSQDGLNAKYLHFSFAFCIIAAAGSYLSGILLVVAK